MDLIGRSTTEGAAQRRGLSALGDRIALILVLSATTLAVQPAISEAAPARKLSERQLRALEIRTLGSKHAADHALQRRIKRARPAPSARSVRRRPLARASATGPASEVGAWEGGASPLMRGGQANGVIGINAALLPTGKVLWYGYPSSSADEASAVVWNPVAKTFKDVPPPINPATGRPYNIFCSGISLLADGRVLVTGGLLGSKDGRWLGLNKTFTFDPFTERWQEHEDMRHGRYYPSQLLMPDGRTFLIQGTDELGGGDDNLDLELFDPSKPLGDELDLFGTLPSWARGDFYPHPFWMPSGRGMIAGPYKADSWFLQPGGSGGEELGAGFRAVDAANPSTVRTYGSAVLLPLNHDQTRGEVVQYGGANDRVPKPHLAVKSAEAYRESTNSWADQPPTNVARAHHNTVQLPDGSMVTVGGGVGEDAPDNKRTFTEAHKQVELWDPMTREWRLGPSQLEGRAYHSTGILLPDGSVVSAGDDYSGGYNRDSYEIYKPPYFFKGTRPTISSAPSTAGYGASIAVGTADTDIDRAVLVAPSTTTHAVDTNQRVVNLPVAQRPDGSGYDVTEPANADVAPPGHYMLFLIDENNRPSTARWVQLAQNDVTPPPPPPSAGTTSPPTPVDPTPTATPAPVDPAPTATPAPENGALAPSVPQAPVTTPTTGSTPTSPSRPRVHMVVRSTRLSTVRRTRKVAVEIRSDSAGRVSVETSVSRRLAGATRRTTVAGWKRILRFAAAGKQVVALRLTTRQLRRLRGDVRLDSVVRAYGSDGRVAQRKVVRSRLR